ncbi:MAG: tetratricopeptide repeat protein [Planctomycetota bacterium]|jgi:serine/threonine protein kinase/predicted Zn-dependent protease
MYKWKRIKELFKEGMRRKPEERAAFLDEACGSDAALRSEVEALLAAQGDEDGFLKPPPKGSLVGERPGDRLVGTRLGQYRLERLISAGGMGMVYEGLQEHPRRVVAIKVMREGIASPSALRRFEYEAEILAHLSHPHIAQVFEAGTHGGEGEDPAGSVPYFVMEFIPNAQAVTDYAAVQELSIKARLELFLQVCDAVHHGHQKGIIHRDLKPTNILVDESGQVKIIDFGVARATDSDIAVTTQTDVGQLLGTVQYMSPEQCKADSRDLDIRSDVYALGVVLYELLCEEPPYNVRRIAVFEATRIICEKEPKRPSTTLRALKGDIETILLKALEKERARRYQSVIEFAADIKRYLDGEVIRAKPAGPATRAWKRIKRNPVVSASIGFALIILLVTSLYVLLWAYPQVLMERDKALKAQTEADLQREAALDAQAEAEKEAERTRTVNDFLEEMLSLPDPGQEGRDVKIVEALEKAVERLDEEFSDLPEIQASLRNTIGWTYRNLGEYDEAEAQLSRAVELAQDTLGKESKDTLRYMFNLCEVIKNQGRLTEAESRLQEVIEIRERVRGKEDVSTLRSMSILADVFRLQGKYSEAEKIITEVLDEQRRVLDENHEDIILSTNVLAGICMSMGRFPEAVVHIRKVLDARRLLLGEEHHATLAAKNNLALVFTQQGKINDAEILHREVLEVESAVLGPNHPHTLSSMHSLASVLRIAGKHEEAEDYLRDAAEARCRVLTDEHPDTLRTLGTLALTLQETGKLEEAESILREISATYLRILGEKHPDTLTCMDAFAITLAKKNKYAEAETLFRKVFEIRLQEFGEKHPRTQASMQNLAGLYSISGDLEKSEGMHRKLLEVRIRFWGEDHPYTVNSKYNLADVLVKLGKHDEAETLYRDVLVYRRSESGESNDHTLNTLNRLADVLLKQGFYSEAERLIEEAFEIVAKYYSEENIHEAMFSSTYGDLLFQQERYEEAEKYLRKAFEINRDIRGEGSVQAQHVIGLLVDLYEAWGRQEDAEVWRAKLIL